MRFIHGLIAKTKHWAHLPQVSDFTHERGSPAECHIPLVIHLRENPQHVIFLLFCAPSGPHFSLLSSCAQISAPLATHYCDSCLR